MRGRFRRVRKRALSLALCFAFLFSCVAVLQFAYVRYQLFATIRTELENWAKHVAESAVSNGKWDMDGYRNVGPIVPNVCVVTSDGVIVDIEGFIHGLIPRVQKQDESLYGAPQSRVSELGEEWLLYARKLAGGRLILGVSEPEEVKDAEGLILAAVPEFGSTIQTAKKVNMRGVNWNVDYAVVNDLGEIEDAWGGIPLKTNGNFVSQFIKSSLIAIEGKTYMIVSKTVTDISGNSIGTIIVPKDITLEEHALHDQIVFNSVVAGASWLVFLLIPVGFLVFDEVKRRQQEMNLEEALQMGENQVIEFKRGFIGDVLAREIAAFANTNAGNIFLGVDDSGKVVGLSETDPYQRGELLRKLRDITSTKISPRVVTETAFLTHEDKTVLRIFVPRGDQPLYSVEGLFYIRQQNAAERATPHQIVAIVSRFTH